MTASRPASEEILGVPIAEAARLLGVTPGVVENAVRRGELPAYRVGRRVRVVRAALIELVEGARHAG